MGRTYLYNLALAFEAIAESAGCRRALVFGQGDEVSFRALNERANRIAAVLTDSGVERGHVVALINHKSVDGFAAMLACLKLGAAYTNLDDQNPPQRLGAMVSRAQPSLVVADEAPNVTVLEVAEAANLPVLDLAASSERIASAPVENPSSSMRVTGSELAYVMFTSGSTGQPKGVAISHQNVLGFIGWARDQYAVTCDDIFTNVNPIYFDNSVFDFYASLFNGAAMAPAGRHLLANVRDLVAHMDACGCTIWFSVPSLLIYALRMRVLTSARLTSLRILSFGGEGFPKAKLKDLFDIYGDRVALYNVYGPTECTCICSSVRVYEDDLTSLDGLPALGPIAPNFSYRIMNGQDAVPAGEPGELCLMGPQVGLGYINDPERTEMAFPCDPLCAAYPRRMYRTGDLVYEAENGWLHFVGRKDNQIKHMGYRIELDEIEAALNALSYVGEAAVVYHRERAEYGRIIAFIASQTDVDETTARDDLRGHLPDYMIPSRLYVLSVLPKSANGKIDRRVLLESQT